MIARDTNSLVTMKMPSFKYVAKWELARIQTSSEQIGLEEKFVSLLAEGREALQKGQLAEAFSLVKQAMTLDESLRSDPRARTLLHEIRAKGTKVRLRGASLVQTLRANTDEIFFTADGKELFVAEKYNVRNGNNVLILNIDEGEVRPPADNKERRFRPDKNKYNTNNEIAKETLAREGSRTWWSDVDVSGDGKLVAAVDSEIDEGPDYHWTTSTLKVCRRGGPAAEDAPEGALAEGTSAEPASGDPEVRTAELFPFSDRLIMCSRLHFMRDNRTLFLLWQRTESTKHRLVLNFSLWDVPELEQLRSFDVVVEAWLEHKFTSRRPENTDMFVKNITVYPDEKSVLLEIKKYTNNYEEHKYLTVDLVTGEAKDPLPHKIKRPARKRQEDILFSNKLKFTGAGNQIVYIKDESTVAFTPLREGEEEIEIRGDFNVPEDIAVSPDGLFLAIGGGEEREEVFVYELDWEMEEM